MPSANGSFVDLKTPLLVKGSTSEGATPSLPATGSCCASKGGSHAIAVQDAVAAHSCAGGCASKLGDAGAGCTCSHLVVRAGGSSGSGSSSDLITLCVCECQDCQCNDAAAQEQVWHERGHASTTSHPLYDFLEHPRPDHGRCIILLVAAATATAAACRLLHCRA